MMFGGFGGGNMGPRGNEAGFGGIPPELMASVEVLEADEPPPREVDVAWDPSQKAWRRPLTFRSLLDTSQRAINHRFVHSAPLCS